MSTATGFGFDRWDLAGRRTARQRKAVELPSSVRQGASPWHRYLAALGSLSPSGPEFEHCHSPMRNSSGIGRTARRRA